ncbi:MAG TPA: fluoride efflux transporter CrcB [Armatimonadota bacterium]|jgi:CrcB protein
MRAFLPVIFVGLGGMVGSMARFGLGGLVQGNRSGFPYGTLVVNVLGCLIMGLLARWIEVGIARPELRYLLGLGFLGGFTTFSTFSFEALRLFLDHNPTGSLLYIILSVGGCLAAVTVSYLIARAIWA